jgi:hypothetical protein
MQLFKALLFLGMGLGSTKPVPVLAQPELCKGVSHNDYLQKRPLQDALEAGYTNIEADIFLHRGQLVVAHWFPYLKGGRTLNELYLKPLSRYVKQHRTDAGFSPITLLIDIKSSPQKTYAALRKQLQQYGDVLSVYENGRVNQGLINIVLTGRKPVQLIQHETRRWVLMDDFLNAPASECTPHLFAMASCRYSQVLKWRGRGAMPDAERYKLTSLVNAAHSQGKKARLWASPETDLVRRELLACGVDYLNTDRLTELKAFFASGNTAPTALATQNP